MKLENLITKENAFQRIFMVLFLSIASYYWYQDAQDLREIDSFSQETIGIISEYSSTVSAHYLTYEYKADDKSYKNEINPKVRFVNCPDTQDCIGRKFVVVYSRKNHEKSKILLDEEVFDELEK